MMRVRDISLSQLRVHAWLKWALIYLLLTTVLGALLRFIHIYSVPEWVDFKNIRHAHSHMGMMGWLFSAFYIFIVYYFNLQNAVYRKIFWALQVSIIGMFLSFPVQGYGSVSIFFTTMHLILSYIFIYFVFKDSQIDEIKKQGHSRLFLSTALVFLLLSTVGVWALGIYTSNALNKSIWYYNSVQFFLHFQFNGWFIFAALAIFFELLERQGLLFDNLKVRAFYTLMVISCFLTFALAVTWSTPHWSIFFVNSVGALLQFAALIVFFQLAYKNRKAIKSIFPVWVYRLFFFAFVCFIIKIGSQTLVAFPVLAITSYTIRNFVIGLIHLILLAMITVFIFGLIYNVLGKGNYFQRMGLKILITSIILTEALLFLQGFLLWIKSGFIDHYHELLFFFSIIAPIGILIYIVGYWRNKIANN